MNTTFNSLALRQLNSLIIENGSWSSKANSILALQADISQLGYGLSRELKAVLKTQSDAEVKRIHKFLVAELSEMVGAHVKYVPLFKNFPDDVPEENLYLVKRIIGYLQNFVFLDEGTEGASLLECGCYVDPNLFDLSEFGACPICQQQDASLLTKTKRKKLTERVKLKIIALATQEDLQERIKNLMSSKSSLSQKDKDTLTTYFVEVKDGVESLLPKEIPIKENMALVSGLLLQQTNLSYKYVKNYVKTATDVLRIAVQLSNGDVSLKETTKFKMKNKERNFIIKLLDGIESPEEDMLRFRQRWLRLGEYLHVGSKKDSSPNTFKAFDNIRNRDREIPTFNKTSHAALLEMKKTHEADKIVPILKKRPGEFARKIDMILRESKDPSVVTEFSKVIKDAATPMLLKLSKHLHARNEASDFRYFIPKGNVAKVHFEEKDERKTISKSLIDQTTVAINAELLRRFNKSKPRDRKVERVYIDPALKNYIVPLSQRSASKALNTVERGSQIPFDHKAKALRFFIYWHEHGEGRIDLDLTATAFDNNWNYISHLSWTELQGGLGKHSGDIQSAPRGASEFIDINLEKAQEMGIRYVAMQVYSFTGQTFDTIEAFAGFMERQKPGSGEVYEAKTVKNKFDLSSNTSVNVPLFLDLKTNKVIWADLGIAGSSRRAMYETSGKKIAEAGKVIASMKDNLPNLFELFSLHALANGAKVDTVRKEDTEYGSVVDESKARDFADITANYL